MAEAIADLPRQSCRRSPYSGRAAPGCRPEVPERVPGVFLSAIALGQHLALVVPLLCALCPALDRPFHLA
jgi:hypothetical protein